MIRTGISKDERRYQALHDLGCIACHIDGYMGVPADMHHLVDKGYRKHSGGNKSTLPLCKWHHQGEPIMDFTVGYMHAKRGPSMFHHGKEFTKRYGTQRELLAKVNEAIK